MLTIDKVLNILRGTYKIDVTRVTIYNWITKGRQGKKMIATRHTSQDGGKRYTVTPDDLKAWVNDNTAVALRKGCGRPVTVDA